MSQGYYLKVAAHEVGRCVKVFAACKADLRNPYVSQKPNEIRPPEIFGAGTYKIESSRVEERVGKCDGRTKDTGGF